MTIKTTLINLLRCGVNQVTRLYRVQAYRTAVINFDKMLYHSERIPGFVKIIGNAIPGKCAIQEALSLDFAPCMINPFYPFLLSLKRYSMDGETIWSEFDPIDLLETEYD